MCRAERSSSIGAPRGSGTSRRRGSRMRTGGGSSTRRTACCTSSATARRCERRSAAASSASGSTRLRRTRNGSRTGPRTGRTRGGSAPRGSSWRRSSRTVATRSSSRRASMTATSRTERRASPERAMRRCCCRRTSVTPRSPTTTSRASQLWPCSGRCKRSRRGDAEVDRAAAHVLRSTRADAIVEDFVPWGGDERQFCSPGFDLPFGALTRTPHGLFPEYHTSADDLDFISAESLGDSIVAALEILDVLERNRVPRSRVPYGEPQLGRRGLYSEISTGAPREGEAFQRAIMWVLNQSDGAHSLLDVAERAELPFALIADAADALVNAELIE